MGAKAAVRGRWAKGAASALTGMEEGRKEWEEGRKALPVGLQDGGRLLRKDCTVPLPALGEAPSPFSGPR